jgi:hypothetical protein
MNVIRGLSDKDAHVCHLSTEVKNTTQLQTRGSFTLILGYEIW